MPDAENLFKEALYRSAIEAAYFLKRLCEGTEDDTRDTNALGIRFGASSELIDAALHILSPDKTDDLDDVLILAELNAE